MIDISRYLNFIVDNKITQIEFTFLYLLYYSTVEPDQAKQLIRKYKGYLGVNALINDSELSHLVDKGFIKVKGEVRTMGDFVLTNEFLKVFIDDRDAADEVWRLYPGFTKDDISGNTFILKAFDFDIFRKIYNRQIKYSMDEHREVLLDIKFGLRNNLLKYKVETFVKGKGWLDIRNIRESNKTVVTKNAAKTADL